MALFQLLFLAIVPVVLVAQLVTPVVLNIPCIAIAFLALVIAIWGFRRARRNKKLPVLSFINLTLQAALFVISLGIMIFITLPHESAGDSSAVVQGVRKFLVAEGIIDKPGGFKPSAAPEKAPETLNAPDQAKVEIKIE